MAKCYDTNCTNEVKDPLTYCDSCQRKYYPEHKTSNNIRDIQRRLRRLGQAKQPPAAKPEQTPPKKIDLALLSYEQLKLLEKKAEEHLKNNKHLIKQDPDKWSRMKKRYDQIVFWLNKKDPNF